MLTGLLISVLTAAPAACRPAATVDGAAALVAAVRSVLARHRLGEEAASGCPVVRVHLGRAPGGISVAIEDPYGRKVQRRVSSAEAAGALIESWAGPSGDLPSEPPRLAAALPPEDPPPPAPSPRRPAAASLHAEVESSVDTNRFLWVGARVGGCAAVGPLCLGGLLRFGVDSAARPASVTTLRRTDFEALLTAGWPLQLRWLRLVPSLGAGLGWMHATDDSTGSDTASDDDRGVRVELSLTAIVPLGRSLSLSGLVALDGSASGVTVHEDGLVMQPWAYLRVGLGLGWSGL